MKKHAGWHEGKKIHFLLDERGERATLDNVQYPFADTGVMRAERAPGWAQHAPALQHGARFFGAVFTQTADEAPGATIPAHPIAVVDRYGGVIAVVRAAHNGVLRYPNGRQSVLREGDLALKWLR